MTELKQDHGVVATPALILRALVEGGHATVTIRSWRTGDHVTLTFLARKRDGNTRWVSRATIAGRVGITDADCIEVRDPNREYPDNYVGRLYLTGTRDGQPHWVPSRTADSKRAWAGHRILEYAMKHVEFQSEVFLASTCSSCARPLTDPESIERGIGPECYGRVTASRSACYGGQS